VSWGVVGLRGGRRFGVVCSLALALVVPVSCVA